MRCAVAALISVVVVGLVEHEDDGFDLHGQDPGRAEWEKQRFAEEQEEFDEADVGEVDFEGKVEELELDVVHGTFDDALRKALEGQDLAWNAYAEAGLAEKVANQKELEEFISVPDDPGCTGGGVLALFEMKETDEMTQETDAHMSQQIEAITAWFIFVGLSEKMAHFGIRFAYTTNEKLLARYKVEKWKVVVFKPPQFAISKNFDMLENVFPESGAIDALWNESMLAEYIVKYSVPRVGEINYENEELYDILGHQVVLFYTHLEEDLSREGLLMLLAEKASQVFSKLGDRLGKEVVANIHFGIVDSNLDTYELRYFSSELMFRMHERRAKGKVFVGIRTKRTKYFRMDGEMRDVDTVVDFLMGVLNNEVAAVRLEGQNLQAAKGFEKDEL